MPQYGGRDGSVKFGIMIVDNKVDDLKAASTKSTYIRPIYIINMAERAHIYSSV